MINFFVSQTFTDLLKQVYNDIKDAWESHDLNYKTSCPLMLKFSQPF